MTEERDRKVLDVTFNSTPYDYNKGWGWRIPLNPDRVPGKFNEEELEVQRLLNDDYNYPLTTIRNAH